MGYKENSLLLTRAVIVWVWKKTMVAGLHERAGSTCFSGVLSNSCSERNSFTEKRAFSLFSVLEVITFTFYICAWEM